MLYLGFPNLSLPASAFRDDASSSASASSALCSLYRGHCLEIFDAVSLTEFTRVEKICQTFWSLQGEKKEEAEGSQAKDLPDEEERDLTINENCDNDYNESEEEDEEEEEEEEEREGEEKEEVACVIFIPIAVVVAPLDFSRPRQRPGHSAKFAATCVDCWIFPRCWNSSRRPTWPSTRSCSTFSFPL